MFYVLERDPRVGEQQYSTQDPDTVLIVSILRKLFQKNMLLLELQEGPFNEGDELLVRGVRFSVKYVQDRRLVLELPKNKRFVRRV